MKTFVAMVGIDNGFELKYYKTAVQGEDEDSGPSLFGVLVEKHVDGKLVEAMESGSVCEDDTLITKIIGKLVHGGVTPFALCETLDDMKVFNQ